MFSLFKKTTPLYKYISKLEKKKSIDFQLDAYRDGNPDFQIIRQRMLQGIDSSISIENPTGFAVIISFNLASPIGIENHNRFKKSIVFNSAIELNVQETDIIFYTIKSENKSVYILNLVGQIQTEVYGYTDDTYYYFKCKEI